MKPILLWLFLTLSFTVNAFDDENIECQFTPDKSLKLFSNTYNQSEALSKLLCQKLSDGSAPDEAFFQSLELWKQSALKEANEFKNLDENGKKFFDFEYFINRFHQQYITLSDPLDFSFTHNDRYKLTSLSFNDFPDSIEYKDVHCKNSFAIAGIDTCAPIFSAFKEGLNAPFKSSLNNSLVRISKELNLRNKLWTKYFQSSRSQTFIDLALNTYIYRNEIKKKELIVPPPRQYFAFHPSIVMQYIDHASDGEQMKEALAVEWLGVNYWNWKIPFGISAVSTYADRASVKDISHGLMFHINNKYSFGLTRNGDDNGIFFTLDLLKLFEDKQSNFTKYRDSAKDYFDK